MTWRNRLSDDDGDLVGPGSAALGISEDVLYAGARPYRQSVEPTPERRAMFAPIVEPRGGYTSEPGTFARLREGFGWPGFVQAARRLWSPEGQYRPGQEDTEGVDLAGQAAAGVTGTSFVGARPFGAFGAGGRPSKITPEIVAEAQKRQADGAKLVDIAKELGVGKTQLYQAVKNAGGELRPQAPQVPIDELRQHAEAVADARARGLTIEKIAEERDLKPHLVKRLLYSGVEEAPAKGETVGKVGAGRVPETHGDRVAMTLEKQLRSFEDQMRTAGHPPDDIAQAMRNEFGDYARDVTGDAIKRGEVWWRVREPSNFSPHTSFEDWMSPSTDQGHPLAVKGLPIGGASPPEQKAENQPQTDKYGKERKAAPGGMMKLGGPLPKPETEPAAELAMFAGERSATADRDALTRAKEQWERGASPDDIWRSTGWFVGPDEKWRYQIIDRAAGVTEPQPSALTPSFAEILGRVRERREPVVVRLGDVLAHDDLYRAYPHLREMPVQIVPRDYMSNPKAAAQYSPTLQTLRFNVDDESNSDPSAAHENMLHELQHRVQHVEDFGYGNGLYASRPGEAESRLVEARSAWPADEQRKVAPWRDPDDPDDEERYPPADLDYLSRNFGHGGWANAKTWSEIARHGKHPDMGTALQPKPLKPASWWPFGGMMKLGGPAVADARLPRESSGSEWADKQKILYGYENAETADLPALDRAKTMLNKGADRQVVWDKTGWWRAGDDVWRFELDDSKATLAPSLEKAFNESAKDDSHAVDLRLGDILKHPLLYKAYPDMMGAKVVVTDRKNFPKPEKWHDASKEPQEQDALADNNVIYLGRHLTPADRKKVLIHEVQHILQSEADVPPNPESADYEYQGTEAEAFNAESRVPLDARSRKARPPWKSFQVPEAEIQWGKERPLLPSEEDMRGNKAPPQGMMKLGGPGMRPLQDDSKQKVVFAGENAKTADKGELVRAKAMEASNADPGQIWHDTGWYKAKDGEWRSEIDDSRARLSLPALSKLDPKTPHVTTLDKVLHHPDLLAAYPNLANLRVEVFNASTIPDGEGRAGQYETGDDGTPAKMMLAAGDDRKEVLRTILHELQHAVEDVEPFDFGPYKENSFNTRSHGEVEARNVERRQTMAPELRRATPPWKTQDTTWPKVLLSPEREEGLRNKLMGPPGGQTERHSWRNRLTGN